MKGCRKGKEKVRKRGGGEARTEVALGEGVKRSGRNARQTRAPEIHGQRSARGIHKGAHTRTHTLRLLCPAAAASRAAQP